MKTRIKRFIISNRYLYGLFLAMRFGSFGYLRGFRKKIRGNNNSLAIGEGITVLNTVIDVDGNNNRIEIGGLSTLNNVTIFVRGDNHTIKIGESVVFNLSGCLWVEDSGGVLEIGRESTFEQVHLAVTEPGARLIIGKDCMVANDVDLRTGDSHSIIDATTGKRINQAKDVTIGDHVWIGSHVSILKGANVAPNSIVGTRSLVTRAFTEPGVVLGGIPAKVLRTKVNWRRPRIN